MFKESWTLERFSMKIDWLIFWIIFVRLSNSKVKVCLNCVFFFFKKILKCFLLISKNFFGLNILLTLFCNIKVCLERSSFLIFSKFILFSFFII